VASSRLRLDRTLGPIVGAWIEDSLVHGPGDVQGQRIGLDDEEARFLCRAYEVDDRGRRKIRRAVYSRPKGRRKSEFGAMIACAEACGPVRFRGWDHDGRPLGWPVQAPYIPIASTEEGQASDNVYAVVEFMLREGPIATRMPMDIGITRTYLPDGGKIQAVSARATSKDGGRETFALFDETHLFVPDELRRLHATIRRNLAKRRTAEPWSLETTTMYAPDEGSVAESSHKYAQKVAAGEIRDSGFLFDHRQAPSEFDWDDDEQMRAALVEVYGDAAEWMDIERLIAEARDPETSESDFRRYFLNVPTVSSDSWLPTGAWAACADPARVVAPGSRITLGFDGSYNEDATGLVGCTIEEVPHLFVLGVWERPPRSRDWVVPRDAVKMAVHHAFETYEVVEFPADPPGWREEIEGWAERYGSPPVIEYEHNKPSIMAPACKQFYSDVVQRRLSHDGSEALARHIANCRTKDTPDGAYVRKESRHSLKKVDLAVAGITAKDRASLMPVGVGGFMWADDDFTDEELDALEDGEE
jgi:phage terminase large subunit-like protein